MCEWYWFFFAKLSGPESLMYSRASPSCLMTYSATLQSRYPQVYSKLDTRPDLSQFESLKIRRSANFMQFRNVVRQFWSLENCAMFGQVASKDWPRVRNFAKRGEKSRRQLNVMLSSNLFRKDQSHVVCGKLALASFACGHSVDKKAQTRKPKQKFS